MKNVFSPVYRADIERAGFPRVDYHVHSDYADGNIKIEDIAVIARRKKIKQIAVTEHIWRNAGWLDEYIARIRKVDSSGGFILAGAEARITNWSGDLNIDLADEKKLDLIIGAMHRYPQENGEGDISPANMSVRQAVDLEKNCLIRMIRKKQADIVGHIGRSFEERFHGQLFPIGPLKNIIQEAKYNNVAVEINARSRNAREVLILCLEIDCPMSFGSDAHLPEAIGDYDQNIFNGVIK